MKVPHTSRLQTTNRHRNHQLTQAHTLLLSHLNQKLSPAMNAAKIKTATSQSRMPQCVPGFSSSQPFTSSSTGLLSSSDHHTEEYVTIWGCGTVYLLRNIFKDHTYKQMEMECPSGFSYLRPTRPTPLPFTNSASHLLGKPQSSNFFATVYNKSDQHGELFTFERFAFSSAKTWCRTRSL